MKKLVSLLLALTLLACTLPFAMAQETPISNFKFSYINGGTSIDKYNGNDPHVVIPGTDSLGNTPVTRIGGHAFSDNETVTSVVVPEGVVRIGNNVFDGCSALTSVTLPQSLTTIADRAFYECTALPSITIPAAVTKIGEAPMDPYVFYGCSSLTEIKVDENNQNYCDINGALFNKTATQLIQYPIGNQATTYTLPDTVVTIWIHSFEFCKNLTSVTIPNSVKDIFNYAFADCSNLTSVTIGKNVVNIWPHAFDGCTALTDVYYGGTREEWEAIEIYNYNTPLTKANVHCTDDPVEPNEPSVPDAPSVPDVPETPSDVPETPTNILLGDISGDQKIDAKDALNVLKFAVGKLDLTEDQQKAAEVDGKEGINAKDALEILKYAVKKIEKFPIQQ